MVSFKAMVRTLILIFIATLMGCGKPPPETLAAEYLEYMEEKKDQGLQFAMAGPDVRSRGKMWENIVWNKYKHGTPGFVWGHGSTIENIEKMAIESCEERVGKNDCYIYYRNNTYVRIAERKKWLASNPAARRLIKREQAEQLKREKQAAQQIANVINRNISVDLTRLTNSVMNSWRADYKDEMGSLINGSNCSSSVNLTNLTNSVMNSWRADYKSEMGSLLSCTKCSSSVNLTNLTNSVMNGWRADYKSEMGSLLRCVGS